MRNAGSERPPSLQQAAAAAAAAAPVAPGMSGGAAVASGGSNAGGYAGVDSPTPGMSAQSNGSPLQQLQAPLAQHVRIAAPTCNPYPLRLSWLFAGAPRLCLLLFLSSF